MNLSFGECLPKMQALSLELGPFRTMSNKIVFAHTCFCQSTNRQDAVYEERYLGLFAFNRLTLTYSSELDLFFLLSVPC